MKLTVMKLRVLAPALLFSHSLVGPGLGQGPQVVTLSVRTENHVQYRYDLTDPLRIGSQPGVTPRGAVANFYSLADISDITEINGKPARGSVVLRGMALNIGRTPRSGSAIADSPGRGAVYDAHFDILDDEGRPVGTLVSNGLGGGPAAPGLGSGFGSHAITGGTGAFLGATGQLAFTGQFGARGASMAEDPANRRINGGGTPGGWTIQLIPLFRPEILIGDGRPGVFHLDFSPVSTASPARPGEVLVATVVGLGGVRGMNPLGQPFPANPLAEVVSPVTILVNGNEAEVVNKIGWPGTTDRYRVDFRIPQGTPAGTARMQIVSGWVPGSEISLPVR